MPLRSQEQEQEQEQDIKTFPQNRVCDGLRRTTPKTQNQPKRKIEQLFMAYIHGSEDKLDAKRYSRKSR